MAFGEYSGGGDSVVARLEMAMPADMDQKIASVHKSVASLETSMASVTRFTKDFMDYMGQMPTIAKNMESLRGLSNSTAGAAAATAASSGDTPAMPIPLGTLPVASPAIPTVSELAPAPGSGGVSQGNQSVNSGQTVINAGTVNVMSSALTTSSTALPQNFTDAHAALATGNAPAGPAADPGQVAAPAQHHTGLAVAAGAVGLAAGLSDHEQHQASRPSAGQPSPQLQSLMDYRQKLQSQLSGSPDRLLNRLWQEGLVTEGMKHGEASYGVRLGTHTLDAHDFLNSKDAQQEALDELARRTQPHAPENAGFGRRAMQGMHIATSVLGAMQPGADPVQTIAQMGQILGSMAKSGNGAPTIGSLFGLGGAAAASSMPAMPNAPSSESEEQGSPDPSSGGAHRAPGLGMRAGNAVKQTWRQFRSAGSAQSGADTASKAANAGRGMAGATAESAEGGGVAEAAGTAARAAGAAESVAGAAGAAEAGGAAAAGGGMLAGIAGAALPLAPLAALAGGFVVAQHAGQQYQNVYNEGTVQGGGFKEGAATETSIQMMAMNPFLTSDQSRQIIMGALNQGYQGKQFDSVTSFMQQNLTDMNMSVADSTKLLQKNVEQGGESLQGLSVQLSNLKDAAKEGGVSLGDRVAAFTKVSGQGVSAGGGGQMSGQLATQAGELFAPSIGGEKNPLAGFGSEMASSAMNSPAFQSVMAAQHYPGEVPAQATADAIRDGTFNRSMIEQVQQLAGQAGTDKNSAYRFQQLYNSRFNTSIDLQQADDIRKQLAGGKSVDEVMNAAKDRTTRAAGNKTSGKDIQIGTGGGDVGNRTGGAVARGLANAGSDILHGAGSLWSDLTNWTGLTSDEFSNSEHAKMAEAEGSFSNPALNKVIEAHGIDNTVVYDPQGGAHKVDMSDEKQMKGLEDGSWKIAATDDEEQQGKLDDDFNAGAEDLKDKSQTLTDLVNSGGGSKDKGGVGGTFELSNDAKKLLVLIPGGVSSDSNTTASNSGSGGATTNNPGASTSPTNPTGLR